MIWTGNLSSGRCCGALTAALFTLSVPALAAAHSGTIVQEAAEPAAGEQADEQAVAPEAVAALDQMATYLRSLTKFELRVDGHRELVTDDGQKIQIHVATAYRASLPDKLAVESRNIFSHEIGLFDGKKLVFILPQKGLYAEADFVGSVDKMLQMMNAQFGLEFPVQDMFRWGSDSGKLGQPLQAIVVGPDLVGGWLTTQYAVRLEGVDFQIWLDQGADKIPRRLVITDLTDATRPQYTANFTWNLNPQIDDKLFSLPDQQGGGVTPPRKVPMDEATGANQANLAVALNGKGAK